MVAKVLERAEKALAALDSETLVSLYAHEFAFEDTASGEVITDKQELKAYFERLFSMPGVGFSEVSFFHCGENGAGGWRWSGLSLKSGKPYSIRGASLFKLGKDRIIKETICYDPRRAYE